MAIMRAVPQDVCLKVVLLSVDRVCFVRLVVFVMFVLFVGCFVAILWFEERVKSVKGNGGQV